MLSRTFFTFSKASCPKINLINQMCLDTAVVFSTCSLDVCIYRTIILLQERILTHNIVGHKHSANKNPFSTWYHLYTKTSQRCLIHMCSPISAFQRLQIYNPSSDDFWSVLHILCDPAAHITFAVCSSLSRWVDTQSRTAPDAIGWIRSAGTAGSTCLSNRGFAYGKTVKAVKAHLHPMFTEASENEGSSQTWLTVKS